MKKVLFAVAGVSIVLSIYSILWEPTWLDITDHEIPGVVKYPLKIVHLTDLHLKTFSKIEKRLITEIQTIKPDLVVLTGDLIEDPKSLGALRTFLSQLKAPLGVYSVQGNWEHWTEHETPEEVMDGTSVVDLTNREKLIRDDVLLVGYDYVFSGAPTRKVAVEKKDRTPIYTVALFHSPALFDEVSNNCDLALAGHSHGGQVFFPIVGALWLPPGVGAYVKGWYEKDRAKMYVNRGVGTSILPIRFGARPELAVINIRPIT